MVMPLAAVDLHVEDFESVAALSASGVSPSWQRGQPTSGPLAAHTGSQCWATSLSGNYANGEDSYLTSGSIDLSAHSGGPFLFSWWQYLDSEAGFDAGSLEVSSNGGVSWERVYGEQSGQVALAWTREFVLLDGAKATSSFRYRFRMRSDGSGNAAGYYIDSVRIFALTLQAVYTEDFEAGDGGYEAEGDLSTWDHGAPVAGPGFAWSGDSCWGTNLDDFYASNEDSGLVSAAIDLSAYEGKSFVVSWRQQLTTESTFDTARVQMRSGGSADWQTGYGVVSGVVSETWMRKSILVGPAMATAGFQLRFGLQADSFFENTGFYVDDVEVRTIEGGITPTVTWAGPGPIDSSTPLGSTQLNAITPVAGTFSYSPGIGALLPPGIGQVITATFTPDDLLTYVPVITTVTIDVSGGISYETTVSFPPDTPPGLREPDADFDGDGSPNFCEYGFVTDVTGGDDALRPRLVILDDGGSDYAGIEFSVRSNDPALQYAFHTSSNLATWSPFSLGFNGTSWSVAAGGPVIFSAVEGPSNVWRLKVRAGTAMSAGGRLFMRVSVVR